MNKKKLLDLLDQIDFLINEVEYLQNLLDDLYDEEGIIIDAYEDLTFMLSNLSYFKEKIKIKCKVVENE